MIDRASPTTAPGQVAVTASGTAKLACLDGLRGLAVLLVILFHLGEARFLGVHPAVRWALWPFRFGFSGVHLFLVLSGFCLALSWLRRRRAGRSPSYRDFLVARWWRIAPPYYLAMVLYLAAMVGFAILGGKREWPAALSLPQVGSHLLFVHGASAGTIDAINGPFWSLSIEFQFYLLLPLLCLLAIRVGIVPVVATVAIVSIASRSWLWAYFPDVEHLRRGIVFARLIEFVLGMAVAFWYDSAGRKPIGPIAWVAVQLSGVGFLAGAIALGESGYAAPADFAYGLGYTTLLVTALIAAERGAAIGRVFQWRWLTWAGTVSYSLYLSHNLVLDRGLLLYRRTFPDPGPLDLVVFAGIFAAILAVGQVYYGLVERRFLRTEPRRTPTPTPKRPEVVGNLVGASVA